MRPYLSIISHSLFSLSIMLCRLFQFYIPILLFFKYLFIYLLWLRWVLVAACRIFVAARGLLVAAYGLLSCEMQTLSCDMHAGSSSPTRDQTQAPSIGRAESYPLDHQGSPYSDSFIQFLPSYCLFSFY